MDNEAWWNFITTPDIIVLLAVACLVVAFALAVSALVIWLIVVEYQYRKWVAEAARHTTASNSRFKVTQRRSI